MTDFISILKENGLKATFQRMHILEVIGMCGHKDVDEIYEQVVKTHPSISLATVYKNILIMTQNGVLVEVPIVGKKAKFEIKKDNHIHFICQNCSSVVDKYFEVVDENVLADFLSQDSFTPLYHEINIYGVCSNCKAIKVS